MKPELGYDLPDAVLLQDSTQPYRFLVWQPEYVCIVIGRGNTPDRSVFFETAAAEGVPVIQRPTGGEAVLLTPAMFIISVVINTPLQQPSRAYFQSYNDNVIAALAELGITQLEKAGISDIALGGRKIFGSSIYRNRQKVFYHGVLNVGESTSLLERYLCYPTRVPSYRQDRPHREFVTSLVEAGYQFSPAEIRSTLTRSFARVQPE